VQLSQNFSREDFEKSADALAAGINNTMPDNLLPNAVELCLNVMQPTRDKFGVLIETSGYRCPELNQIQNGSEGSQHMRGEALDFLSRDANIDDVFYWMRTNLIYDQIILENHGGKKWIHG